MTAHPFPNVRGNAAGTRWQAYWPCGPDTRYLGTYSDPITARVQVLTAQAEHFENKAARYRDEIRALLS